MTTNERLDKEARDLSERFSPYAIARAFLGQCVDNPQTEEKEMTLDEFDTKLKTLLRQAGQSGIDVKLIAPEYFDASTQTEEFYALHDYRVEYSRGGRE